MKRLDISKTKRPIKRYDIIQVFYDNCGSLRVGIASHKDKNGNWIGTCNEQLTFDDSRFKLFFLGEWDGRVTLCASSENAFMATEIDKFPSIVNNAIIPNKF